MSKYRIVTTSLQLIIFSLLGVFVAQGALAGIDPGFNPNITKDVVSSPSNTPIIQPDGKILLSGAFPGLRRINSDGTPDATFNCPACESFSITSVIVQPDGKIVIGGTNGSTIPAIRVNPDGSQDNSFGANFTAPQFTSFATAEVHAIQPDGKILIRYRIVAQGQTGHEFHRLNTNGSEDNTFTPIVWALRVNQTTFSKLAVLADGKLLLAGTEFVASSATGFLERYNSNGSTDDTFENPNIANLGDNQSFVEDFAVYPDGSLIVSGKFTTVNSVNRNDLVRLLPAGNVDLNFTSPSVFNPGSTFAGSVALLPNGQILVNTANFNSVVPVSPDNNLLRLNADGSVDSSYQQPASLTYIANWTLDNSNRAVLFGTLSGVSRLLRLNTDGSLDTSFNPIIAFPGSTSVLAVQPNGKILVGGSFDRVDGIFKNNFARINADGTLDPTFDAGTGFNAVPLVIAFQADGGILVGGAFTTFNGTAQANIARLNPNGSLDTSFNPVVSAAVNAIKLTTDGKILIGGSFTTVNSANQAGVAKLNADGSLVSAFNPIFGSANVQTLLIQTDGKIMVGGSFNGVNGFNRQNLVRLNSDATLDTTFTLGGTAVIKQLINQPDGKYLALSSAGQVFRLSSTGANDPGFATITSDGTINSIVLQSDGSVIIGGSFTSIGGNARKNIARFSSNRTFDSLFLPTGASNAVTAFAPQNDGNIIVVGSFRLIGNVSRAGIARINFTNAPPRVMFDYDGDGKSDVSVFRASENKWYILQSSNFALVQTVFAVAGDVAAPGDYDGDGKTDVAVFRPSTGQWWYQSSINNAQVSVGWGQAGDIPRPADFDGDGKTDFIVYRPSNSVWYRYGSTGVTSILAFGIAEDKPLVGDFDGDGKADFAIFRPSTGDWWYASSVSGQFVSTHWGSAGDVAVPADYDGDGKTDLAVYRASTGGWYIYNSGNGSVTVQGFGLAEDKPIAADYDGDGKADIAVFRPSSGTWYLLQTTAGFGAVQLGIATDLPTENAFVQ